MNYWQVFFECLQLDERANYFFLAVLGISSGYAEACYTLILEDFAITVDLRNRFGVCCSKLSGCSEQFTRALFLYSKQLAYLHIALHTPRFWWLCCWCYSDGTGKLHRSLNRNLFLDRWVIGSQGFLLWCVQIWLIIHKMMLQDPVKILLGIEYAWISQKYFVLFSIL